MAKSVSLDDVFPGLRRNYTEERVDIRYAALNELRAIRDDSDIEDTLGDLLKEKFCDSGNPTCWLKYEEDGEEKHLTLIIDDDLDENEMTYYVFVTAKRR